MEIPLALIAAVIFTTTTPRDPATHWLNLSERKRDKYTVCLYISRCEHTICAKERASANAPRALVVQHTRCNELQNPTLQSPWNKRLYIVYINTYHRKYVCMLMCRLYSHIRFYEHDQRRAIDVFVSFALKIIYFSFFSKQSIFSPFLSKDSSHAIAAARSNCKTMFLVMFFFVINFFSAFLLPGKRRRSLTIMMEVR